jgi:hypothetical protein
MAFAQDLVTHANAELTLWTEEEWVECVLPTKKNPKPKNPGSKRVAEYWKNGLGIDKLNGCNTDQPWSAAFICWCMRQAGMALTDFPFASGHHAYIRWAVNNTKNAKIGKSYYGRRLDEYAPRPGDLIAQWRKPKKSSPDPKITFDEQPDAFYASHCDIVVAVIETAVIAVGGNVGNRVKTTTFPTTDGLLDAKKELICVLECRKT